MNVRELNRINSEISRYESQMVEAKEMLEKLFKEVEESKANPIGFNDPDEGIK